MANAVTYTQSPFNKSRKDKFIMVFSLPKALYKIVSKFERTENKIMPDTLQFSVYGNIVPNVSIPAIETRYAGQTLSHSSHSREPYEPNRVNFTIDNRFNNYWVIYSWLSLLNDDEKGVYDVNDITEPVVGLPRSINGQNPNMEYRSDILIYGLDEYNKRIVEFKYTNAFPTNLGGINYNYRDSGEIESEFTYNFSQLLVKPITEYV
jgi:hypothetical protein